MNLLKNAAKLIITKRAILTKHLQDTHQTPQPHQIFLVPEILEKILSFLSAYTLKHGTSVVCRLWREISLRSQLLPPVTVIWSRHTDTKKEIFTEKLAYSRCLHLKDETQFHSYLTPEKKIQGWDKLQEAVVALYQDHRSSRITQLIVEGELPITKTVEKLLRSAPLLARMLTTIRIENNYAEPVLYIDRILSDCKNLANLYLEASHMKGVCLPQLELRADSDIYLNRMKAPLKLRRLTIKLLRITYDFMETLLPHCTYVKSFEIVESNYKCHSELSPLYHLIARSLVSLEHIHMSFLDPKMARDDAAVFRQVFSHVRSWSFHPRDFKRNENRILENPIPQSPSIEFDFPILTSLDIVCKYRLSRYHYGYLNGIVHDYLVSPAAASLVHLRIENFSYQHWRLNLDYRQACKSWTCRNLETLHFGLWTNEAERSEPQSRVILNHLTRLLPRMRSLRLEIKQFDLDLEGGLCLLMRMKYLEKVHIITRRKNPLTERDLHWLNRHPTVTQRLWRRSWIAQLRQQLISNPVPENATIAQISSMRSLEELIECLEDINSSDDTGTLNCLPWLESLVIETLYTDSNLALRGSDASIAQLVRTMRSDFRFRIIRNNL